MLRGRWEVKEPSKDLVRQEAVRGIIQCVQSPECELERLGYIVRGEADRRKVVSRNVVWVGSCFWKILLVLAGG